VPYLTIDVAGDELVRISRLGIGVVAAAAIAAVIGYAVISDRGTASADTAGGTASRLEELLAQKLGISVEALQAAQKGARDQLADELLAAGTITQAQADRIKSSDVSSGFPRAFGFGGRPGGGLMKAEVNVAQITADLSHIDLPTLRSELSQGKSLAQVADEHGVSRDTLKNAILDAEKSALSAQVAKGNITQAAADEAQQRFSDRVDALIDSTGHVGGLGPMRGHFKPEVSPTP
jgi:predicted DNA-binding protein (UPF0251 family)